MTRSEPTRFPSRRSLAAGLLWFAAPAVAKAACRAPSVLFVCPVGTVKSPIAREHLRRAAVARGLAVEVRSRGVEPADHVSPALAAHLKEDGVDTVSEPVRKLAPADIARADIVIAFDEAVQAPGMAQARVWDVPSWNSNYAEAKAALAPKIEALVEELAGRPCQD